MNFDNTLKEAFAFPIIDTLIDRDDTRYRDNLFSNTKTNYTEGEIINIKSIYLKNMPNQLRKNFWMTSSGARREMINNPNYYYNLLNNYPDFVPSFYESSIIPDLERTFPFENFFQKKETLNSIYNILLVFSRRNVSIGYCQGFNFIVGRLYEIIKNEEETFWLFTSIIENLLPVEYYCELAGMMVDCAIIKDMINDIIPEIPKHLKELNLEICLNNLLYKWLVGLFVESFNKDTWIQIYDAFFLEGNIIIFRSVLAILMLTKDQILSYNNMMDINTFFEEKINEFRSDELLSLIINEKNEKIFNFNMDDINNQRDEKFIRIREQIRKTGEFKKKQNENKYNVNDCNPYYPNCLKTMFDKNIIRSINHKIISEPIFENNFYDLSNGKRNVYELVKSHETLIKNEEEEIKLMNEKERKKCIYEDLLMERISHKCKKKLKNIKRRPHSSSMMGYLFEQLNSKVNNDDEILNEKNNTNLVNSILEVKFESQNSLNVSRIIDLSESNDDVKKKRNRWTVVKREKKENEKKEEEKESNNNEKNINKENKNEKNKDKEIINKDNNNEKKKIEENKDIKISIENNKEDNNHNEEKKIEENKDN